MHHERYMKSILIQQFRSFYDELISLKNIALEEKFFMGGEDNPTNKQEIEVGNDITGNISFVQKMINRLEKYLRAQYRLVEIQGGEYVARYYNEAQYIMVSLADEIFLNLPWKGRNEWQDHLLESRLYGTQDAGDKFFSNLDRFLQQRDTSSLDLAVVYLMALGLGFQGKYREEQNASPVLDDYRKKIYEMINYDNPSNMEVIPIFANAYDHTVDQREAPRLINLKPWYLGIGVLTISFIISIYIVWFIEVKDIQDILKNFSIWMKENAAAFN